MSDQYALFAPYEANRIQPSTHSLSYTEDPDNSLLELILEDYLNLTDAASDPQDNADHLKKKFEYIRHKQVALFDISVPRPEADPFYRQSIFSIPFLETVTLPPKLYTC
jgi:hypothetical protein